MFTLKKAQGGFSMIANKRTLVAFIMMTFFFGSSFSSSTSDSSKYLSLQLLGMNDFHGQLETYRTVDGKQTGGAEYLAAYLKKYKNKNKNTLLVHAGDMVGGSAPTSALLQDEPTIDFMNRVGFDVGVLGNHELDEGFDEMMRLLHGGKPSKTKDFKGVSFPYTAANMIDKNTHQPILPPYIIKKVNGIPIGFIGIVTTETKDIVLPSGIENITFMDEVTAINKSVKELKQKGVKSIVVIGHVSAHSKKDGTSPSSDLVEFAPKMDDEVDIIFGGHNHSYANTVVDGKLIVESYSYGTAFSSVDVQIDPKTKDIVKKNADIVRTYHDGVEPDEEIKKMVDHYGEGKKMLLNHVIGKAEEPLTKDKTESGERAIGDLIADSHREAMGTDFSFMNPGAIRASLDKGTITWGQLYTMLPFGTHLVKMSLKGKQIKNILEQQWTGTFQTVLQTSGLHYTWNKNAPAGEKVTEMNDENGKKLNPDQLYTVAVTNYLATGGDGFTAFKEGTNQASGPLTLDAFIRYIHSQGDVVSSRPLNRIALQ